VSAADTRLALKIDVDTHDGLARGVPALADLLATHGVRASFFVVCGPDRMGRRLARLLDPRFVAKLLRTRVIATYPLRTLLSGFLLPARPVAGAFPATLARLVAGGHEVGVHGWDHARWQDRLPRLAPAAVRDEVTRASDVLRGILGRPPAGFAAPGWRCTAESLAAVDEAGFAYRSDTRGSHPYRPAAGGRVFRAPEIPTTWPTLDEVYGPDRRSPSALAERWTALLRPGALNVHTIHAELEGGAHLPVLDELVARAKPRCRFVRLADEATALGAADLPVCEVREGTLPGRAMPVALQCE
jgi:peptidoglycan/xylan/chitin deacetylase (PgdA/CDA1 family)